MQLVPETCATPINTRTRDASPEAIARDAQYGCDVFRSVLNWIIGVSDGPKGARILELGPGHNYAAAVGLAGRGAHVAVADRWLPKWDPEYHPKLYSRIGDLMDSVQRWRDGETFRRAATIMPEIEEIAQPVEYLGAPDDAYDFVISNAVLEHLFDHKKGIEELARVTAPGGWHFHQVDYRDHRDFARPLELLLMDPSAFEAFSAATDCENGCQHRACDHIALFEAEGFELRCFSPNAAADDAYLNEFLVRLRASASSYRERSIDDLRATGAMLMFRKREGPL